MTLLTLTTLLVTRVNWKTKQYASGSPNFWGVRWTLNIGMTVGHPALVHDNQSGRAIREQSHHRTHVPQPTHVHRRREYNVRSRLPTKLYRMSQKYAIRCNTL
jgi:hypothetical protein